MKSYTLKRIPGEFPEYEVWLDGTKLGIVRRAWFRLGGNGWTHDGMFGLPTRWEAANDLVKKALKKRG